MDYSPSFVGHRKILSESDKRILHSLARAYLLKKFLSDSRNYEELSIDFIYTSAKIEGNTYSQLDTDNLIKLGITSGGKRYSDALMLLNLRKGLDDVMLIESGTILDFDLLRNLHQTLMRDLLPLREQGIGRSASVSISGTKYRPPEGQERLRAEVKFIMDESRKYDEPFEKSIYLHCNLAYLQYFTDGNKRTARMMQTAALVSGGMMPLIFNDALIEDYRSALIDYYETGRYEKYVAFFLANYQLTIDRLVYVPPSQRNKEQQAEYERRMEVLESVGKSSEIGKQFYIIAKLAMDSVAPRHNVNWDQIERDFIVQLIESNSHEPDFIFEFICKYSPGTTDDEKKEGVKDDIFRLSQLYQERGKDSNLKGPAN